MKSGVYTGCDIISASSNPEVSTLEGIDIARRAVDIASDKQASNIVLLEVRDICTFCDYFVICSGDNERQMRTIYDDIELNLKKEGQLPHHNEGTLDSGWLLLDYGDVIVHVFSAPEREFYRLDEFWHDARSVIRIQ